MALNKRKKNLRSLKRELSNHEREIGRVFSSIDKFILDNVVKKNVDKITKATMKTPEKKLRNLKKVYLYHLLMQKLYIICHQSY